MRADLSRGHRPDEKRGQRYRRVLTQQGRLWLDSDVAASVDATDGLLRRLTRDVGCPAGSPDTGYLTSPGPAFAWFDSIDHVGGLPAHGDPFRAFRDYAVKYMERFPSLYIDARAAAQALTIRGRRAFAVTDVGTLRLWMRLAPGAAGVTVTVNSTTVPMPVPATGGFGFDAYDYDLAAAGVTADYDTVTVNFASVAPANEAWIGFIEGFKAADSNPLFWVTEGSYAVDGLGVEWTSDSDSSTFLRPYLPLPAGTRFVAYVEAWERLVTHVEEPGLRDSALGGLDTTVRTRPMGQVKLAELQGAPVGGLVDAIAQAFHNVDFGRAELTVAPATAPPNPDPCAIPVEGGYNADENRLYRFEVHTNGNLGVATIKWSRNNGSELYDTTIVDAAAGLVALRATPGTAPPMRLVENDIVELITEEVDLTDLMRAQVVLGASPSIVPAERRVGSLCVVATTTIDDHVVLHDLVTGSVFSLTVFTTPSLVALRLRKWDGLIQSTIAPSKHTIEDGLDLELSGSSFHAGDYWQFEARRRGNNASTPPWTIGRHGPERLLAPLALFGIGATNAAPVELQHWFDDRYRPLCELRADDIYYDGDKRNTDADTVQEAIDELYELVEEREGGGCCDLTLAPSGDTTSDDTTRLQDLIGQIVTRGKICLERGVYNLLGTISIDEKHITIEGCPEAVILATAVSGPVFLLGANAGIALDHLVLRATGDRAIIQSEAANGDPTNRITVELREAWLYQVGGGPVIRDGFVDEPTFNLNTDEPWDASSVGSLNLLRVSAEGSVLCGSCGILTDRSASVELSNTVVSATRAGLVGLSGGDARFVIRDSRVTCDWGGAALAAITAATRETLVDAGAPALEALGDFVDGSVAIAASETTVEVYRSLVGGAAGVIGDCRLVADGATFEASASNAVFATQMSLSATETSFRSDRFAAIHGLSAAHLDLASCVIGGRVGVALGVSTNLESRLTIDGELIRISGCRFERDRDDVPFLGGVLIGGRPSSFSTRPARSIITGTTRVEIVDNRVMCEIRDEPSFGISVSLQRRSAAPLEPEQAYRIEGNTINGQAVFGVCVAGTGFLVSGNDVGLGSASDPSLNEHASIAVYGGGASVIADNTLRVVAFGETDARGIALIGARLEKHDDIVVRGNRVHADPANPQRPRPLVVDSAVTSVVFKRLVIEGNEFEGGSVSIERTEAITVRANRFAVEELRLSDGVGGTFQENRVRNVQNFGDVRLSGLSDTWLVDHNECTDLRVRPVTFPLIVFNNAATSFAAVMHDVLVSSDPPDPGRMRLTLVAAFRGLTNDPSRNDIRRVPRVIGSDLVATIRAEVANAIGATLDALAVAVAFALPMREDVFRAHVADNVVRSSLAVGHPAMGIADDVALPHADSWVQVLGNQAGGTLGVNQYRHLIVVNNLAERFSPTPLGDTAAAVTNHNHRTV